MAKNADPRSAAALRLNAAGLTPPVSVLMLHGWSPGPGLPGSLLASGLFTVHEIEASTILTIATNRYALALVGVLCATFVLIANVAGDVWYVWFALLPALFGSYQLKKMAVGYTLDSNVAEASRAIARKAALLATVGRLRDADGEPFGRQCRISAHFARTTARGGRRGWARRTGSSRWGAHR